MQLSFSPSIARVLYEIDEASHRTADEKLTRRAPPTLSSLRSYWYFFAEKSRRVIFTSKIFFF